MSAKRPGFNLSAPETKTVLLPLFWSLEDGEMFSFETVVDKTCKLGRQTCFGCLNVTEVFIRITNDNSEYERQSYHDFETLKTGSHQGNISCSHSNI